MSNLLVVGLVAAVLLVVLGLACLVRAQAKRKGRELGTPLVEQGFSAL